MTFLLKFVDWIAKTGESEVARRVEVSRQSVHAWRRWAAGAPRSSNVYPPSVPNAKIIVGLSRLTLTDIYGKSE